MGRVRASGPRRAARALPLVISTRDGGGAALRPAEGRSPVPPITETPSATAEPPFREPTRDGRTAPAVPGRFPVTGYGHRRNGFRRPTVRRAVAGLPPSPAVGAGHGGRRRDGPVARKPVVLRPSPPACRGLRSLRPVRGRRETPAQGHLGRRGRASGAGRGAHRAHTAARRPVRRRPRAARVSTGRFPRRRRPPGRFQQPRPRPRPGATECLTRAAGTSGRPSAGARIVAVRPPWRRSSARCARACTEPPATRPRGLCTAARAAKPRPRAEAPRRC
jgi:hypothetical protein